MSCSQNFSAIIRSITKKTDGGENPFIGFSNIVEMDEQRDQIVDSIADKIADESRKSTETILSYDFDAIGKQLKKISSSNGNGKWKSKKKSGSCGKSDSGVVRTLAEKSCRIDRQDFSML